MLQPLGLVLLPVRGRRVVVVVARVEIGVATVVGTMVVGVDTVLVKDALVAFVVVLFCSCNA